MQGRHGSAVVIGHERAQDADGGVHLARAVAQQGARDLHAQVAGAEQRAGAPEGGLGLSPAPRADVGRQGRKGRLPASRLVRQIERLSILVLVGSNVLKPAFWRPAVLPLDSEIEMETLDPNRRPLRGYIDGVEQEQLIHRMTIRVSRTAAAELVFDPAHDPVAKLAFVQFPKDDGS
jgi:hypothetical protein